MDEKRTKDWPAVVEGPLTELERIRSELDTLFHRFEPVYARSLSSPMSAMHVSEAADAFLVEMDLAGVEEHEIELSASGNTLTVLASREVRRMDVDKTRSRHSTERNTAQNTVRFPAEIDPEGMDAKCAQGKLTVRLPKVRRSALRRMTVRREGEGGNEN